MTGFTPAATCEYAFEYMQCGAITPKLGLCLAPSSGKLAVSTVPEFICLREEAAAVSSGTVIPVLRISQDMMFAVTLDGSTSLKVGDIASVKSDGMQIDADGTTNRCFEICAMDGTASGDTVYGRFVDKIADPAQSG